MRIAPDNWYEEPVIQRRRRLARQVSTKTDELLKHVKQPPHSAAIRSLDDTRPPELAEILHAVTLAMPVAVRELTSPDRARRIGIARLVYYKIAFELSGQSLGAIGLACGGRDHTTVINGLNRAKLYEARLAPAIAAVKKMLGVAE